MNAIDPSSRRRFSAWGATLRVLAALSALMIAAASPACVASTPEDGDRDEDGVAESREAYGQNIAAGKPTSQSSTYTGSPASSAAASLAVDGNTDGVFNDGSVTSTNYDTNAWWQVDLGSVQPVGLVRVWNRTDCCQSRLSNYDVKISQDGTTWQTVGTETATSPQTRDFTVNRRARFVRVQLRGTDYLSLAEVQVFAAEDLALGKSAWQTSTYAGASASRAVDGNTDGNWGAGSVSSTNEEWQPKLTIDLGSVYNVGDVHVWNRTDCCSSRLTDFNVLVSSDGVNYSYYYYPGPAPTDAWFSVNTQARYVLVQLTGYGYLSLAEVQVFQAAN